MMVYVIGTEVGPKKVGISSDPQRRCGALAMAGLRPLKVLFACEVPPEKARLIEGHAHYLLRDSSIKGEWFKVGKDAAIDALSRAVASGGEGNQARRNVGRKKQWAENVNLTLPEGAKARMDAALVGAEDRLDLIREAIERELKRRERAKPKE
jgi:hypothetical protein